MFIKIGGAELRVVPSERVKGFRAEGEVKGNPYAERRVMTADEHLQMRFVLFFVLFVSLFPSFCCLLSSPFLETEGFGMSEMGC